MGYDASRGVVAMGHSLLCAAVVLRRRATPLGVDVPEGSTLVLRAAKHETKAGILPVYTLVGGATSCVASVAIDSTPRDHPIPLPALEAADRLLIHSATNTASEKTLVYDLAICTPDAYVAEGVATNAPGDMLSIATNTVELVVPTDGTNLYLEVRTRLGTDVSDWTPPFPVTLATSGTGGDSGGEAGDDDPTPTPDGLAAPSHRRGQTSTPRSSRPMERRTHSPRRR